MKSIYTYIHQIYIYIFRVRIISYINGDRNFRSKEKKKKKASLPIFLKLNNGRPRDGRIQLGGSKIFGGDLWMGK